MLTVIAFEAAYQTRSLLPLRQFSIEAPMRWSILMAVLLAVVGVGRAMGIYARLYTGNVRRAAVDTLRQVALSMLALMALLYLLNLETPISRPFTALLAAYLACGLIVYRAAAGGFRGELRKALGAEASFFVVGDGEKALEMARELEAAEPYGARLSGIVDCGRRDWAPRSNWSSSTPCIRLTRCLVCSTSKSSMRLSSPFRESRFPSSRGCSCCVTNTA